MLFAQLHSELELYYTQLLDDVVKICLSTVKYPGASSNPNQVLRLAMINCKHVKLCSVRDCYQTELMKVKNDHRSIFSNLNNWQEEA